MIKTLYNKIKFKIWHWRRVPFFSTIGQITLAHAFIEQDLKSFLFYATGNLRDKIHGKALIETCIKEITNNPNFKGNAEPIKLLLEEFRAISKKRNEILKTIYSLDDPKDIRNISIFNFIPVSPHQDKNQKTTVTDLEQIVDSLLLCRLKINKCLEELFQIMIKNKT